MKSDEVFLKGVYEKAKELQKDKLIAEKKYSPTKRVLTKYMSVAAVLAIVVSIGVSQRTSQENQSVKPQPHGIKSRNIRSLNPALMMADAATDIFEVKAVTKRGTTAYEISKSYKGDSKRSELKEILMNDNSFEKLNSRQTAVYFLQADSADSKEILSIFYVSEDEPDVFINEAGMILTRDELESIKEKNKK